MDELVKLVHEKTGIDEAQARGAAETVIAFLKERLPAPIAAQIDGLLSGGAAGALGDIGNLGNLGGLGG